MKKFSLLLLLVFFVNVLIAQNIQNLMNGSKNRYKSAGVPKALGLNIVLDYPSSWTIIEGKRPHILHNIKMPSEEGKSVNIAIQVTPIESDQQRNEIRSAILNPTLFAGDIPQGASFITSSRLKIDGIDAASYTYEMSISNDLVTSYIKIKTYSLVYNDKLITFLIGTGGITKTQVDVLFNSLNPVFALIMNSVMIENQWLNK